MLASFFAFAAAIALSLSSSASVSALPSGFATTDGTRFSVDGKTLDFVGANSYWLPLLTTETDVHTSFQQMRDQGVKVVRTWGFNAINGSELAGALESNLTYYQLWNSSELDYVVETASQYGIKMIVTFTNNWHGSDLYLAWIAGNPTTHDVFFTDPKIVASYQRYVRTIVERYKDSPNVFAWELMNEARCGSDTYPSGPACVPGSETVLKWYKEQSDFVRSLDPFHMITTGGEGQFFWPGDTALASDFNFNGQAGEDFDRELFLDNIDFATYLIPGSGFDTEGWGIDWITNHSIGKSYHCLLAKKLFNFSAAATRANKPIILESLIYPSWVQHALDLKHAIMPWQFGALGLTEDGGNRLIKYADEILNGASPNDGLAIYKNNTAIWDIFANAALVQDSRSR
ncbi:glycoside hydrolase [Rhodocollybia butyracea]|uniref:mannan endo-1,4-beta-mannosidase n=1 Tax=Rhodocollybia butyracea TaxID=206335 RepID=A0A9P5U7L6_9AGAR|nr:glycoside hydrolase [Rhodocollybia butyracea]